MSTPAMRATTYLMWCGALAFAIYILMVIVERAVVFHEAYTSWQSKVQEEAWLLLQCGDPQFYSNLRQHTDLCETVHKNSRKSALLTALSAVAANTFLCGDQQCISIFYKLVDVLGWKLFALAAAVCALSPYVMWTLHVMLRPRAFGMRPQYRDRFIAPHYEPLDDLEHRQLRRRTFTAISDA